MVIYYILALPFAFFAGIALILVVGLTSDLIAFYLNKFISVDAALVQDLILGFITIAVCWVFLKLFVNRRSKDV